ncbi:hypothetical protein LTR62_007337 [Meristemomyces frigidus]|uniref:Uncharacterized protein n=1 Tax=Meristemomyces frigidus TaxID=1508187 RepID=A0AAN7THG2_9PEZI|nr:hypothetical protein LTR62_007337 [Meristemomyces frigidus]
MFKHSYIIGLENSYQIEVSQYDRFADGKYQLTQASAKIIEGRRCDFGSGRIPFGAGAATVSSLDERSYSPRELFPTTSSSSSIAKSGSRRSLDQAFGSDLAVQATRPAKAARVILAPPRMGQFKASKHASMKRDWRRLVTVVG